MSQVASDTHSLSALTTDAAWIVDADGRITFWNREAEQLFGYTTDETVGQYCPDIMQGCRRCRSNLDRGAPANHPPFSCQLNISCKDGSSRHIKLITVILGEEGLPTNGYTLHIASEYRKPMNGLRIRLLGAVVIERTCGSHIDSSHWRRTKVRGLLAILALNQGMPVHRERLIEALWADMDYTAARQNLNSTVYDLRQSLATASAGNCSESLVIYESNHYALRWSPADWLDTVKFEEEIHQAREDDTPDHRAALYRQAIDLYRGDFLSDVILVFTDDYYLREQWRLRELYLDALEELGVLEEQLGREEAAQELYSRVVALDPCREHTYRRLMRLLLQAGDWTGALVQFQKLAVTLKSELGTVPDRETYRLFDAALHQQRGE